MKFTAKSLKDLQPSDKPYVLWDDGYAFTGSKLGVRVAPTGVISLFVQYRADGKESKKTLCRLEQFATPTALREQAQKFVAAAREAGMTTSEQAEAAKQARDAERAAQASERAEQISIAQLGADYLALRAGDTINYPAYADGGALARLAVARAAACWGDKPLSQLTRGDAKRVVDKVASDHGTEAAVKVRGLIPAMLKYAKHDLGLPVSVDIFQGMKIKSNAPRTVVLDPAERKAFFEAADAYKVRHSNRPFQVESADILRLIFLTASRKGEVLKAEWSEIDMDTGLWSQPASKRKQGKDHSMLLDSACLSILQGMRDARRARGAPDSPFVCPHSSDPSKHRGDLYLPFKEILKTSGVDKALVIHDLRASRITQWNREHGLSFEEIARYIGSSAEMLRKVYDREQDTPEAVRDKFAVGI